MARSSAAADDLVQDACVTALQNAPEGAEMRPWLRSAMRKLAWGRARADTRRVQREEIFSLNMPPSAGPDPLLRYGVDRARLAQALDTLPEPFRSTVVQRYLEGRSCAEIARAAQVPAGTVRWRQTRALELLRGELEGRQRRGRRVRQARIVWLLPALGIQRAAAAVSRDLLALSAHAKLAGLALAGLVVAYGLHLLDDAEQANRPASPDTALAAASVPLAPGGMSRMWEQPGPAARAERLPAVGSAHGPDSRSSHATRPASSGHPGHRRRAARRPRVRGMDPGSHPASRVLEDCWLDERGQLRCHKPPMTPTIPGRPSCDFLNRNVAFIDTTRSTQLMKISYANRFLSAALLANMALAANLGCQLYVDSPDGTGSSGGANRRADDPPCVTKEGPNGSVCTTCTDEAGAETTMCAPADCHSETLPDGSLCTTCVDEAGNSETVCETPGPQDPEQPDPSCFTYVEAWRFMCTVCDGGGAWETECVAAQCSTDGNGCYTCVDENGRTESGCSENLDCWGYGDSATGAHSFTACTTSVCPDGTATRTCHYPGPETCNYTEIRGSRCLSCGYPDGSGTYTCLSDPNDPMPDPLFDRPADLPAPGTCVTEASPGGFWSCTTCTEADGYASSNCSYGAASSCTAERLDDDRTCSRCTYPDGSVSSLCFLVF